MLTSMNAMDTFIVWMCGVIPNWFSYLLPVASAGSGTLQSLRMLRIFRLTKLLQFP